MVTQSKNKMDLCINLSSRGVALPGLQALLAKGFSVRTRLGGTLSNLLCDQLGIDPDYLQHRVQTLFLNSSPVDDVENTTVSDGDVVALSAAMPGLVGATMRKGGFYAKLRQHISYREDGTGGAESAIGTVTIRLFNVIAKELGPSFLKRGVMVEKTALYGFLKIAAPLLGSSGNRLLMNGEEISIPAISEADQPGKMIHLTIETVGDDPQ
jgi:hypothetical protein